VAFLNNAITPIAFASRGVAYKHTSAGLFSEYSLNLAVLAGHLPISIVANAIFATILYFLVGFDGAGGRWAFFVLVGAACWGTAGSPVLTRSSCMVLSRVRTPERPRLTSSSAPSPRHLARLASRTDVSQIVLLMDLAISTLYRSMAYAVASQETAMIASSVFIAVGAFGQAAVCSVFSCLPPKVPPCALLRCRWCRTPASCLLHLFFSPSACRHGDGRLLRTAWPAAGLDAGVPVRFPLLLVHAVAHLQ